MTAIDALLHYAAHGPLTEPREHAHFLDALPDAVPDLCGILQGLIVHADWATRYGLPDGVARSRATQPVADRLQLIVTDGNGSLAVARPAMTRMSGTCRDFALMLCGMLRHRAIPARVRCGFATYFTANPFEDHWVCEYWNRDQGRWVLVDAQLDELHRQTLNIDFDTADLPADKFVMAGEAWRLCRRGGANPASFGHGADKGLWFVRVNLVRDLLALHKQETSPWDTWRMATAESKTLDDRALSLCDRIAAKTASLSASPPRIVSLPGIASVRVPPWQL